MLLRRYISITLYLCCTQIICKVWRLCRHTRMTSGRIMIRRASLAQRSIKRDPSNPSGAFGIATRMQEARCTMQPTLALPKAHYGLCTERSSSCQMQGVGVLLKNAQQRASLIVIGTKICPSLIDPLMETRYTPRASKTVCPVLD